MTTTTGSGATIEATGLRKAFHSGGSEIVAVDGVALSVPAGQMVAVTGPSGSGKSTVLHLLGAIERADAGSVRVDGVELTGLRRGALAGYRRRIGFVFQRYHLLPALTVLDNVIAPVLPYRVEFDRAARARELLDAVGLADRERALPAQLSGGQQQRVAIARALVGRPGLLLADEPTGNLDSRTGAGILELLRGLRARYPMTVLIATHEHQVAAQADRLIRLRDGAIVDDVDLGGGPTPADTLARANQLRI
ncbi:ABC transporter ATP-binding protein [Longispora urticae]